MTRSSAPYHKDEGTSPKEKPKKKHSVPYPKDASTIRAPVPYSRDRDLILRINVG